MISSSEAEAASKKRRSRAACEECRRRKLRCDGVQPQCGVCRASGLDCEVTPRDTRGPKKGHLKALKSRIAHLEALLEKNNEVQPPQPDQLAFGNDPSSEVSNASAPDAHSWLPEVTTVTPDFETLLPLNTMADACSLPPWSLASAFPLNFDIQMRLTDLVRAELDQLYMDRVHISIPIIHQRRYMSWSKSHPQSPTRTCLQYAMWTLATLLSAQFRDLTDPLYRETKKTLENLSIEGNGDACDIELVQAWVLLVVCESMRAYHRQAWMSSGQLFRIVQALRFHEIDLPRNKASSAASSPGDEHVDAIETEERRRVFWMAYLLDHLLSMRNDWPVTLNEHVICTRLPVSDADFQSGLHVKGPFLSEAIAEPGLLVQSSFTECLILVTISGRALLRGQFSNISKAFGGGVSDSEEQHRWLNNLLTSRLDVLSRCYPGSLEANDPLILFANILGQATVLYHCKGIMDLEVDQDGLSDSSDDLFDWRDRALKAAKTIIHLASTLGDLHYSKASDFYIGINCISC